MAQEWCVAYGVLDNENAKKIDKIICLRKGTKPSVEPKKNNSTSSSSSSSKTVVTSVTSKGKQSQKEIEKEKENEKLKEKMKKQINKRGRGGDEHEVDTGKCKS